MPLQRSEVVDMALKLLDDIGLDALSTRRLAGELDVRPGALYWHVASKQDLLDALTEKILDGLPELPTAPGTSWRDEARGLAGGLRDALLAHRDGARLLAGAVSSGPNRLAIADRMMGALSRTGAPLDAAAYGNDTVMSYITGFVLQEQSESLDTAEVDESQREALFDAERYPYLAVWARSWTPDSRRLSFEAGLDILLEGLSVYLAREAEKAPHPRTGPGASSK
ncbi:MULTISPECIES: TetR/AcrR family transcriptional regulator C-terminal domain-containing protein [Streptomyces]|uniref:TetR family transcriptional regulator n=1 Tax=Streptomyces spororaveus TaxID=284039 RepID=A0ABQ3TAL1_9ACTN|nr:TetR/AcrR family transcriptional regulator C-terminal domain-containing protein [Streptomyces spororaveus]GHI77132.1 TetR family transcriptional regulator [Streptomyces spororaveus]